MKVYNYTAKKKLRNQGHAIKVILLLPLLLLWFGPLLSLLQAPAAVMDGLAGLDPVRHGHTCSREAAAAAAARVGRYRGVWPGYAQKEHHNGFAGRQAAVGVNSQ